MLFHASDTDDRKIVSLHRIVTCQSSQFLRYLLPLPKSNKGGGAITQHYDKTRVSYRTRSASVSVTLDRRLSVFWRAHDYEGEKECVIFYFYTVRYSWLTDVKEFRYCYPQLCNEEGKNSCHNEGNPSCTAPKVILSAVEWQQLGYKKCIR